MTPAEAEALLRSLGLDPGPIATWAGPGPRRVLAVEVPGSAASGLASRVRPALRDRGWLPAWLGTVADHEALREHHSQLDQPAEEILRDAEAIDPDSWFEARRDESLIADGPDARDLRWMEGGFLGTVEIGGFPRGEWPEGPPPPPIPLPWDADDPEIPLVLGLIPARSPWEIPAHTQFGGWGECPLPAEWCALLRAWHGQYGAEVVGLTGTSLELSATHPPADRASALELAWRQASTCPRIFSIQFPHLDALAAARLGATRWRLRWD